MKSKRPVIAVAMELTWPYAHHYMTNSGIVDYAREHTNWQLDQTNYPEVFLENGVSYDGIIGRITSSCYDYASQLKIPMVNLWMNSPVIDMMPTVCADAYEAGSVSAEHLIARGFKRLIQITFKDDYSSKLQVKGFKHVADKYGIPCTNYLVPLTYDENPDYWATFLHDIHRYQEEWQSPIGLSVVSDSLARNLASILINLNWKIPHDIAIVATGKNQLISDALNPTLSAVVMGNYGRGYKGAELLDKLLQGKTIKNARHVIPCEELVVQQSSDVYAVDDPIVARALEYMSNNSNSGLTVDNVAKKVGVGRRSLERRFKKLLNRTINNELVRLRIERLKRLLAETDAPVNSLCGEVGFGTNVHMHNTFKRYTGLTPTQYRKEHKSKRH